MRIPIYIVMLFLTVSTGVETFLYMNAISNVSPVLFLLLEYVLIVNLYFLILELKNMFTKTTRDDFGTKFMFAQQAIDTVISNLDNNALNNSKYRHVLIRNIRLAMIKYFQMLGTYETNQTWFEKNVLNKFKRKNKNEKQ